MRTSSSCPTKRSAEASLEPPSESAARLPLAVLRESEDDAMRTPST